VKFSIPEAEWLGVTSPVVIMIFSGGILLLLGTILSSKLRIILSLLSGLVTAIAVIVVEILLKPYHYTQQLPMEGMFVYDRFGAIFHYFIIYAFFSAVFLLLILRKDSLKDTIHLELSLLMFLVASVFEMAVSVDIMTTVISTVMAGFCIFFLVILQSSAEKLDLIYFLRSPIISFIFMIAASIFLTGISGSTDMWEVSNDLHAQLLIKGTEIQKQVAGLLLIYFYSCSVIITLSSFLWTSRQFRTYENPKRPSIMFVAQSCILTGLIVFSGRIIWIFILRYHDTIVFRNITMILISVSSVIIVSSGIWKLFKSNFSEDFVWKSLWVHFGFVLMCFSTMKKEGLECALIYFAIFVIANSGIAVFFEISKSKKLHLIQKIPIIIFLMCLGGIPGTGGFTSKYFLFKNIIFDKYSDFRWLAGAGILLSIIQACLFLKAIVKIIREPLSAEKENVRKLSIIGSVIFSCLVAAIIIITGFYWKPLDKIAKWAMMIIENEY